MILITGSTGFIGRHLVERLAAAGYPLRCLVHERQRARAVWENAQPEIIWGSLFDEEVLFRAVTGVHTIIHLEGAQWWGNVRELERLELVGTRNLVEAARAARVGRFIIMSHLGATPSSAYPLMRVKGVQEELVRTSGLAYTIVRAGLAFGEEDAFINHIAMMLALNPFVFYMPGRGEVVLHPIYIHDLIDILTQTLENIDTIDRIIEIGGLEYITLRDLIRTVMRVTQRERLIVSVPPYTMRWLNPLPRVFFRRSLMTPQWFDLLATNRTAQLGNVPRYYKVQLHRIEDTLLTYLPKKRGFWAALRVMSKRIIKAL